MWSNSHANPRSPVFDCILLNGRIDVLPGVMPGMPNPSKVPHLQNKLVHELLLAHLHKLFSANLEHITPELLHGTEI